MLHHYLARERPPHGITERRSREEMDYAMSYMGIYPTYINLMNAVNPALRNDRHSSNLEKTKDERNDGFHVQHRREMD